MSFMAGRVAVGKTGGRRLGVPRRVRVYSRTAVAVLLLKGTVVSDTNVLAAM
jgi:hypothetical protein